MKPFIRCCSRYTSKGAVFAEKPGGTFRDLLIKPAFDKSTAIWIDEMSAKNNMIKKTFF